MTGHPKPGGRRATRPKAPGKARAKPRVARGQRGTMILDKAIDFFAEHGPNAQTRALAAACGVNQRLLYRYFSSKASLQAAVFQEAIITPFQAVWLVQLKDRSIPFEQRLAEFYRNYYAAVLTRKWLRLFLFDSLAETRMAPGYFELVILELLETVVIEASHDLAVKLPKSRALVHEIGWVLHGAVSHLGIRRQVYAAGSHVPEQHVIVLLVRGFLAGFAALVTEARAFEAAGK